MVSACLWCVLVRRPYTQSQHDTACWLPCMRPVDCGVAGDEEDERMRSLERGDYAEPRESHLDRLTGPGQITRLPPRATAEAPARCQQCPDLLLWEDRLYLDADSSRLVEPLSAAAFLAALVRAHACAVWVSIFARPLLNATTSWTASRSDTLAGSREGSRKLGRLAARNNKAAQLPTQYNPTFCRHCVAHRWTHGSATIHAAGSPSRGVLG
jgi:hypothetical protein